MTRGFAFLDVDPHRRRRRRSTSNYRDSGYLIALL